MITLAEKGGSRTLRGPYDPQTGFEDPFYASLQPKPSHKAQQSQASRVCIAVGSWGLFLAAYGQQADTFPGGRKSRTGYENHPPFVTIYGTSFFFWLSVNCPSLNRGDGNEKRTEMFSLPT